MFFAAVLPLRPQVGRLGLFVSFFQFGGIGVG